MHRVAVRSWILLPVLACACQSLQTVPLGQRTQGELPRHSWVVMLNGARVPVEGGTFSPDSIIGTQGAGRRFAVSRDSVASIEARRVNAGQTLGAVGVGAGVVLTGAALALLATLSMLN